MTDVSMFTSQSKNCYIAALVDHFPGNRGREHAVEEVLGLLLLLEELARPLGDELLEVVGVLLEHLDHLVHDVGLHPVLHGLEAVADGHKVRPLLGRLAPAVLHDLWK